MTVARDAPTLNRDDVTLRALEVADAEAWLAGEDTEQLRWFEMPAASRADVVRAIERWRADWHDGGSMRQWGIWIDGGAVLVGGVELRVRHDGRANLSYVVFPAFRRRGLASTAVALACEWGKAHLPIDAIVAIIDETNVASRGVVEANGFTLAGRAEPWEHNQSGVMLRYLLPS